MTFIGIDPGKSGGVAVLHQDGHVLFVGPMPSSDHDLFAAVQGPTPCRAVIERVASSPQMGVTSAFTFGQQFGRAKMALAAAGIPFDEVAPAVWQRAMQCLSGGDKHVTRTRALQLFPGVRVTHAIADALLIAEFARRMFLSVAVPEAKAMNDADLVGLE